MTMSVRFPPIELVPRSLILGVNQSSTNASSFVMRCSLERESRCPGVLPELCSCLFRDSVARSQDLSLTMRQISFWAHDHSRGIRAHRFGEVLLAERCHSVWIVRVEQSYEMLHCRSIFIRISID